jgi:hypothetical protein
MFHPKKTIF